MIHRIQVERGPGHTTDRDRPNRIVTAAASARSPTRPTPRSDRRPPSRTGGWSPPVIRLIEDRLAGDDRTLRLRDARDVVRDGHVDAPRIRGRVRFEDGASSTVGYQPRPADSAIRTPVRGRLADGGIRPTVSCSGRRIRGLRVGPPLSSGRIFRGVPRVAGHHRRDEEQFYARPEGTSNTPTSKGYQSGRARTGGALSQSIAARHAPE